MGEQDERIRTIIPTMSFEKLGLGEKTLKAISESGYKNPTPIQEQAVPPLLAGRDFIGIAQTGTGKTASFTWPMLDLLSTSRVRARMARGLILEPTRELAAQVAEALETYGKYHNPKTALLIGGTSMADQERVLERGADIIIATPGRLLDHFGRGNLMLSGVRILVIDEADRMLDMGFIPDIQEILRLTPFTRQTLLFSATMHEEIEALAMNYLQAPLRIAATSPATVAAAVTHRIVSTPDSQKLSLLKSLMQAQEVENGIIFCNRKRHVDLLFHALKKAGFKVAALHGDLDQIIRMRTLLEFRNKEVDFLVASDVAARGLDIPHVSHVFNYDVPHHAEDYVHRVGRTGRAGHTGYALTLATDEDGKYLQEIEKLIGQPIEKTHPQKTPQKTSEISSKPSLRKSRKSSNRRPSRPPSRPSRAAPHKPPSESDDSDDSDILGFGDQAPQFLRRTFSR